MPIRGGEEKRVRSEHPADGLHGRQNERSTPNPAPPRPCRICPRGHRAIRAGRKRTGGSGGPDGLLCTTGHDLTEAYVLRIDGDNLGNVRTGLNVGFFGQAIAWDRSSEVPALRGCQRLSPLRSGSFPRSVALPQLASDGSLFHFHVPVSYRGLAPHFHRAHAGHTQAETQQALSADLFI